MRESPRAEFKLKLRATEKIVVIINSIVHIMTTLSYKPLHSLQYLQITCQSRFHISYGVLGDHGPNFLRQVFIPTSLFFR